MKKHYIFYCLAAFLALSVVAGAQSSPAGSAAVAPVDSNSYTFIAGVANTILTHYYRTDSTGDNKSTKKYSRWRSFWDVRASNDAPDSVSAFYPYKAALRDFQAGVNSSACLGLGYRGDWHNMGPLHYSFGQTGYRKSRAGRINSIWVSPNTENHILAGAASGGLWETKDGGLNWTNITDGSPAAVLGTMGVTDIAVQPNDTNHIYVATGIYTTVIKYGTGLAYSNDGGQTWYTDNEFRNIAGTDNTNGWMDDLIPKIRFSPSTNVLYAIYRQKVYCKNTWSAAWADITPPPAIFPAGGPYRFSDIEYTNNGGPRIVVSTQSGDSGNNIQYVYFYNENTFQWSRKQVTFPGFQSGYAGWYGWGICDLAITSDNKLLLYCVFNQVNGYSWSHHLFLTDMSTTSANAVLKKTLTNGPNDPRGEYRLAASTTNPNVLYLCAYGTGFVYRSGNAQGSCTFDNIESNHDDGRCILLYKNESTPAGGANDVVFIGNDGGIDKKKAGENYYRSLNGNGLVIAQLYSQSTSPSNDGLMIAGAQDNGTQVYMAANTAAPWSLPLGVDGDGLKPRFANNGVLKAYKQTNSSTTGVYLGQYTFNTANNTAAYSSVPDVPDVTPPVKWNRPIDFSSTNQAQAGYHSIWNKDISASSWLPTFTPEPKVYNLSDPQGIADNGLYKNPKDFFISEQEPGTAYIAYEDVASGPPSSNINYGKLFRKKPGFQWVNISIDTISTYSPISDIEVDPLHPNRIWVAFGNVNWGELNVSIAYRTKRVMYSDNYGDTWHDVSKGLPALPVHKVIYIPGSDDELFAGTDVGVYRWDKQQQMWLCFGDGMPKCIVTDLQYIPCSGMLRAATYGRGVWEGPYREDVNDVRPGDAVIITANTTWNSSRTIDGSVRVRTGKILTINGSNTTIYMPRNARILVEKGATIVVDNARITNDCDNRLWQGIELWGDKTQPPGSAQGKAILRNHAVIENAIEGIRDFTWDNGAQGGGRMDIQNTTFLNCYRGVELNDYANFPNTAARVFKKDTFIVNSNRVYTAIGLPASQLPTLDMFSMWNTNAITIDSCTFIDDRDKTIHSDSLINGIYTIDARYTVSNSTFTHLKRGVCSDNTMLESVRGVTVINNKFNNVREGVTGAETNPLIADNIFNVLHPETGPAMPNRKSWAVYLTFARSAAVLRNNISGSKSLVLDIQGNVYKYGIVFKGTGNNSALAQSNQLTNLNAGFQAEYTNSRTDVSCNNFKYNTYAMTINPQSTSPAYHFCGQGYCGSPAPPPLSSVSAYPNNVFDTNFGDISSFTPNSWGYVVKSGGSATYVPINNYGSVNVSSCSTGATLIPACSKGIILGPKYSMVTIQPLLAKWQSDLTSSNRYSDSMMILYQAIVKGYTDMDSAAPLQVFLEADTTDESRVMLLPFYFKQKNMTKLKTTVNATSLSVADKQAYQQYYNIMDTVLSVAGSTIRDIDSGRRVRLESLANGNYEVSPAVKSLLEFAFDEQWEREPEDIPEIHARPAPPEEHNAYASWMGDAHPNPASGDVSIEATIIEDDAEKGAVIRIVNIQGRPVATFKLTSGKNNIEVDTKAWASGTYFYSLLINNKILVTKKLSKM